MASNPDTSTTTRREHLQRTAGAALTVSGASVLASTTASAQTDSDEERGPIDTALMMLAGIQGELDSRYERRFGNRSDAETAATNAQEEFNANSDEWVDYINDYASLDGDIQVVALEYIPNPDEDPDDTHTDYLVTEYDGETYTSAEIVDSTDRTVDETVRLESIAAENADDEVAYAYEEFVSEDEPPSDRHLSYLAGKYRYGDTQHVTTTILGDDLGGDSA